MTIAALALALTPPIPLIISESNAQAPRLGTSTTAEGRVRSLTTAPKGEIDGALLDNGTVIHWPPHLADWSSAVVSRGDRVSANGWMETGPAGDTHLEARAATNLRTNTSAEIRCLDRERRESG